MATLFTITEGWTGRLGPFILKINGAPLNLAGMTIDAFIRPLTSNAFIDSNGDVIPDADPLSGKVYWEPDALDVLAKKSPYTLHFRVIDSGGKVVFFPMGEADQIKVAKV